MVKSVMPTSVLQQEINQLSTSEKLLLVEELWDQIAENIVPSPLPEAQRIELDRRYEEFLQNPAEGSSWNEVKRRILGR